MKPTKTKYQKNKKITCKCGCVITKNNLKQHESSKKHIDLINQNQ